MLGRWPEATVSIPPLRYEQVSTLIHEMLGAPADVAVVARVLAKSGGNLRLAARIIEAAMLSDRLVLRDGRWSMSGKTLMNEHLHPTLEGMLHGLTQEEFKALTTFPCTARVPWSCSSARSGPMSSTPSSIAGSFLSCRDLKASC